MEAYLIPDMNCNALNSLNWETCPEQKVQELQEAQPMLPVSNIRWWLVANEYFMQAYLRYVDGNTVITNDKSWNSGTLERLTTYRWVDRRWLADTWERASHASEEVWDAIYQKDPLSGSFSIKEVKELTSEEDINIPAENIWNSEERVSVVNPTSLDFSGSDTPGCGLELRDALAWKRQMTARIQDRIHECGGFVKPYEAAALATEFMGNPNKVITRTMDTHKPAVQRLGDAAFQRTGVHSMEGITESGIRILLDYTHTGAWQHARHALGVK